MRKPRSKVKQGQSETPAKPARRWRRWIKPIARVISVLTIGLIVAHWFWGRSAERALDEQIHDYAAAGEPIYPSDLNDPPMSDADNAVIDLRKAGRLLDVSAAGWVTFAQLTLGPPLSQSHLKVIAETMEANREALKLLDAATRKSAADWQMNFASPVLAVKYEELVNVLSLSTLLRAAALSAHQTGDEDQAIAKIEQMLKLARIVDRQRKLTAHLTAASIHVLAAKTAADIAPDLHVPSPAAQHLHDLIGDFLNDGPLRENQIRALQMTRVMFWDTAKSVEGGRNDLLWRDDTGPTGGRIGTYAIKPLLMNDGLWLVQYMSKLIDAAKFSADWPEFCQNAPPAPMEIAIHPRAHLIANRLLPDLTHYVRGQYRAVTECRLAAVALACGWYAHDHAGEMPKSLEDLKPTYLSYVPFDPMAGGGKPLHLGGTSQQRTIYSVGDDGIDDGGSDTPSNTRNAQGAGPWDRRDFVVRLTRRMATTKPATRP